MQKRQQLKPRVVSSERNWERQACSRNQDEVAKRSDLAYGVEAGGNQIHGLHGALLGGGDEEPAP